jgi:hypothetical protein
MGKAGRLMYQFKDGCGPTAVLNDTSGIEEDQR